MDPAWTEVLDDACIFATGATTEDEIFDLCTYYLFHAYKFAYDGKKPHYWFEEKLGYALSYMIDLDRVNGADPLPADCQDVSSYLSLCVMSLGSDAGLMRLVEEDATAPAFVTNPICPIGLASTDPANYSQAVWALHQVTTRAGLSLFRVYDACAAQKWTPAGSPHWNPPRDWALSSYWQTPNPGVPGRPEAFFGLVERPYGAPTPQYVPLGIAAFAVQGIF
jgi:hypothetical protein